MRDRLLYYPLVLRRFLVAIPAAVVAVLVLTPNFTTAHVRSHQRRCFAHQKTIAGAIEMYNLDFNTSRRELDPGFRAALVAERYLEEFPRDPGAGPGSEANFVGTDFGDGILCLRHGAIHPPPGSDLGETGVEQLARVRGGASPSWFGDAGGPGWVGPPAPPRWARRYLGTEASPRPLTSLLRRALFDLSLWSFWISVLGFAGGVLVELALRTRYGPPPGRPVQVPIAGDASDPDPARTAGGRRSRLP